MLRFTQNEMRRLQVGEVFGPYIATRREVHAAQQNICNYKQRYPGAEFRNWTESVYRDLPDGSQTVMRGYFEFYVERTAYGTDADTGEPE